MIERDSPLWSDPLSPHNDSVKQRQNQNIKGTAATLTHYVFNNTEMPPRIPTAADFEDLKPKGIHFDLVFPNPPESTTAILLLFHGLGDSHVPFTGFARNVALPGVLAISIRGVNPLPSALLDGPMSDADGSLATTGSWHYGDDIHLDQSTGEIDSDPGFEKATKLILSKLIKDVLVVQLGWDAADVFAFGLGQGGSLALGLAAKISSGLDTIDRVTELAPGIENILAKCENKRLKGVISIGGPLPQSCVSSVSARDKSKTPVLLCGARRESSLTEEVIEAIRAEFVVVQLERWAKNGDAMPNNRDEMFPIMKFFAEYLKSW